MAKKTTKITSTRRQKGPATKKPQAVRKESAATKREMEDEGWGPIGAAAKKVAKGAVKGAAKEVLK